MHYQLFSLVFITGYFMCVCVGSISVFSVRIELEQWGLLGNLALLAFGKLAPVLLHWKLQIFFVLCDRLQFYKPNKTKQRSRTVPNVWILFYIIFFFGVSLHTSSNSCYFLIKKIVLSLIILLNYRVACAGSWCKQQAFIWDKQW